LYRGLDDTEGTNILDTELIDEIHGCSDLLAWFGYVPSFHDAEVLSLDLIRQGAKGHLRVHRFQALRKDDKISFDKKKREEAVKMSGSGGAENADK
jgi:hypothetical protein